MKKNVVYDLGGMNICLLVKILLKMKLTFLLILLSVVQLLAFNGYSQSTRLTVNLENVRVEKVLLEIEEQSNLFFIYNREAVDVNRKVNVSYSNMGITEILEDLFKDTDVTFEILESHIVLKSKSGQNDRKKITGVVTDVYNKPLPGVSVIVKGTTIGITTNVDGKYSLDNVPGNSTLVFSFVGMKPQEISVAGKTIINVVLEEKTIGIEEVVAVGYGVQKKVNLTGAVDVIDNKQIENRQSPTVSQLLQGQSPGLTFSIGSYGFQPGAQMEINIRGIGSLNGGSPYVLIDGIPGDMDRLNPDDIKSISVLKDAAASAIYGARAPYGVILITTKSGAENEKINVTYSGSVSVATPQNLPEMLNSATHARVINEAGANRGGRPFKDEIIDRMYAYINGDIDYLRQFTVPDAIYFETMPRSNGTWGFNQYGNANYDWFDEYYGSAINQKHNISLKGGTQATSYYFSAGYLSQESVLNYGEDTFERMNVMGKINTAISDWWDFNYQVRFMKSNRVIPNMDNQGSYDLIFHQIARTMPMNAKYDGYGNIMIQSKIPWVNDAGTDNIETTENWHTFATEIRPLKGWKINADFAYKSVDYFRSDQELTVYDHLVDQSLIISGNTNPSSIQQFHQSNNYWTTNIYTSYELSINDLHNFTILGGTQYEVNNGRSLNAIKNNLIVPDVLSLQTATGEASVTEGLTHWATQGYFGRLSYNYNEKYLAEANIRRDGTSRFRDGKRWGIFPSVSIGWNINKERFWSSIEKYINALKIRGSWGALGNQNVASYQDLELIPLHSSPLNWIFNFGQTRPVGYTGTPALVSPDLSWETVTTKNLGVNMAFLDSRLQADFDLFERNTTNMIGPALAQPGVLGASLPRENNATLRTRGWEFALKWKQTISNDFSYFVDINLYDSKSVVTKYLNPTGILSNWYAGKEQGEIWGYTAHDLYRTQEEVDKYVEAVDLSYLWGGIWRPGDLKYEDITGDGVVDNGSNTLGDHGDLSIIGNSTPHYQFGVSAGLTFKNFDFSMIWKGIAKRDIFFSGNDNIFWGFRNWNQSSLFPNHLDYFRDQPGDKYTGLYEGDENINIDAYWPRPYIHNGENNKNRIPSTRYLQNAAYARLQNVQLGYNLPRNILSKLHLQKLRIYASGENLLTISKLPKGIDPVAVSSRWGAGKTYGADRIVSLGLIITY
ncbi:Outer membrane TonB-dependent transporter, utilization system for glycans and polysaccharides (PUL), SusC family [hydrothermal vent metagenome]|uniref:Outer membrane TonB-dependent transporter, utilization system for glycans and polysaccharides (PUL), SusC family n=1 Tax=hydrothermal vent metagenome TaxID=652676 RepID=A0A3B0UDC2_9ZZZZ